MPSLAGGAGCPRRPVRSILWALLVVASVVGCVERKLLIRSDPPGADVYIDEVYRGETPLDIPFTFYRARLVELRKDGFEPERFLQPVPVPFYQIIPLDFFFEVMMPFTLVDEHRVERRLEPEPPEIYDREFMDDLRERATGFRER
jgi:hypothetical protein